MKTEIVTIRIDELDAAEYNPRRMDDEMSARLDKSIDEFGVVELPVVNRRNNRIVGGHQRIRILKARGTEDVTVVLVDLDDQKEKALNLALNKIDGEWDQDKLMSLLLELDGIDYDLTGFGAEEAGELLAMLEARQLTPEADEDDVPTVEHEVVSRPGEVWILGRHRLVIGDSRDPDIIGLAMQDDQADMIFTDPPYNVDYQSKAGKIQNDKMSPDEFKQFLQAAFATMSAFMKDGASIYVAHSDTERGNFEKAMVNAGIKVASCLVWVKNQLVMGRADYHWQHEPILYGWKKGGSHHWHGDRKQSTVQEILDQALYDQFDERTLHIFIGDRVIEVKGDNLEFQELLGTIARVRKPLRNVDHPTMKPVALVERYITNSSRAGQIVADFFGGSGSTLIGCEKTGRTCRTCELDLHYADVIIRRWQKYTGREAIRQGDQIGFDSIKPRKAAA